jgi:hypothetical protein
VSIEGTRFEIPAHLRNLKTIRVRYARWDLGYVHLVDKRTGDPTVRIYPIDKHRNADGRRRVLQAEDQARDSKPQPGDVAPLLKELFEEYAATGLPPAYIPKDEEPPPTGDDDDQETTS